MANEILAEALKEYEKAENNARQAVTRTEYASPEFYQAVFEWLEAGRLLATHVKAVVKDQNDRVHD